MTDRIQTAYCRADAKQRRLFNQALFEAIWIDQDVANRQLAAPFDDLVADDLLRVLSEAQVLRPAVDVAVLSVRLDPDGDAGPPLTPTPDAQRPPWPPSARPRPKSKPATPM